MISYPGRTSVWPKSNLMTSKAARPVKAGCISLQVVYNIPYSNFFGSIDNILTTDTIAKFKG